MPSDALEDANAGVAHTECADGSGCLVGGIVIYKDHFVADRAQGGFEEAEDSRDVRALVISGNDDSEFERAVVGRRGCIGSVEMQLCQKPEFTVRIGRNKWTVSWKRVVS
ncbi:MAG: hypothetical protein JO022_08475 [Acidobacteriaceae bacterium]|nr:hypothetical protein [Acidobacteriaceae bacterium]